MEFKTQFNLQKGKSIFIVNYGKEAEEFNTDKFYSNKVLASMVDTDRTEILDIYVNEKDIGDKIFNYYRKAKDALAQFDGDVNPIVKQMLKLFNYKEYKRILLEHGFMAPNELGDELDKSAVRNARITAGQTYLKREYMDLLPIIGMIKCIGPILAMDVKMNPGKYKTKAETLSLALVILSTTIPKGPLDRIMDFIDAHLTSIRSEDELLLAARKKKVSVQDIPYVILGNILFNKFMGVAIERKPPNTQLIINMYSSVTSGSTASSGTKDSVRLKNLHTSPDTGEKEPWAESSRQTSSVMMDQPEYYNFISQDMEGLLRDFDLVSDDRLNEIITKANILNEKLRGDRRHLISNFSVTLLKIIVTKTLPVDSIDMLYRENLVNLLTIGAFYLEKIGLHRLAPFLLLIPDYDEQVRSPDVIHQISKEVYEDLIKLYPYLKEVRLKGRNAGIREEYPVVTIINDMIDNLKGEPSNFIMDTDFSSYGESAIPYPNIKDDIAKLTLTAFK